MSAAPLVPYENAVRFHTRSHGLALLLRPVLLPDEALCLPRLFRAIAWRKWALHTIPLAFSQSLAVHPQGAFSTRFLPVLPHTACDPNRASHSLLQASFWGDSLSGRISLRGVPEKDFSYSCYFLLIPEPALDLL